MKRSRLLIASGALVLLIALWGGAYLCHLFPYDHWAGFAALMTSVFTGAAGFALIGVGLEATE